MSHWLVVPIALLSALCFAMSAHWKHHSAAQTPSATSLRGDAVVALIRATLTHKLWLGGIVADAVGLALQIAALHLGALSTVQCLLVSGLIFALVLRRGPSISRVELRWASSLALALIVLILVTGVSGTTSHEAADRLSVLIAGCVGAVIAAACLATAARDRCGHRTGVLLGVAVGIIYAATAALLKSATNIVADRGLVAAILSWQVLAVAVLGATGLTLGQIAFQSGPLSASLPTISSVDPLLSVAIGAFVFEEHVTSSLSEAGTILGCVAVIAAAVWRLSVAAAIQSAGTSAVPAVPTVHLVDA